MHETLGPTEIFQSWPSNIILLISSKTGSEPLRVTGPRQVPGPRSTRRAVIGSAGLHLAAPPQDACYLSSNGAPKHGSRRFWSWPFSGGPTFSTRGRLVAPLPVIQSNMLSMRLFQVGAAIIARCNKILRRHWKNSKYSSDWTIESQKERYRSSRIVVPYSDGNLESRLEVGWVPIPELSFLSNFRNFEKIEHHYPPTVLAVLGRKSLLHTSSSSAWEWCRCGGSLSFFHRFFARWNIFMDSFNSRGMEEEEYGQHEAKKSFLI